jgi:hypothetical protein
MKSANGYFERLANDPEFAREMSERQRRIGQWPRRGDPEGELREPAKAAVVGAVANVQDIAPENYAA